MDLRSVGLFVELARQGHYGRTAASLGMAQPALSQHILRLERDLRCRLFDRTNRSVDLTAAGQDLLGTAEEVVEAITALQRTAARLRRADDRTVTLGATRGLPADRAGELAAAVADEYDVRVVAFEWADSVERVRSGEVDVVVTWLPQDVDQLSTAQLGPVERRCVILPLGHPLATRDVVSRAELAGERVVPVASQGDDATLADWFAGLPVAPDCPPARNVEDVLDRVARGQGIAFANRSQAAWLRRADVTYVPVPEIDPVRVALVWHPDAVGGGVQALVERCRAVDHLDGGDPSWTPVSSSVSA